MEFYDKFADRFQDISKVKNPAVSKEKVQQLLRIFKRICFGKYDAVTLTMLYLKVLHDMASQINFSDAAITSLEIYALNTEENYLT